jgi:hypothetical protein
VKNSLPPQFDSFLDSLDSGVHRLTPCAAWQSDFPGFIEATAKLGTGGKEKNSAGGHEEEAM